MRRFVVALAICVCMQGITGLEEKLEKSDKTEKIEKTEKLEKPEKYEKYEKSDILENSEILEKPEKLEKSIISDALSSATYAYKRWKVVPDVIDVAPKHLAEIWFPSGAKGHLGNELTPTQTQHKPNVSWTCDPHENYTVLVVDVEPLGPKTQLLAEGRLLLVGNIKHCDYNKGETIVEYLQPLPLLGTGLNRYVVLVFKQRGHVVFTERHVKSNQEHTRYYTFARILALKYDLQLHAGNFFVCQYDPTVTRVDDALEEGPPYIQDAVNRANLVSKDGKIIG